MIIFVFHKLQITLIGLAQQTFWIWVIPNSYKTCIVKEIEIEVQSIFKGTLELIPKLKGIGRDDEKYT